MFLCIVLSADRPEPVQPATTAGLPKPARAKLTVQVGFTAMQHAHLPARQSQQELKASKEERDQLQLDVRP